MKLYKFLPLVVVASLSACANLVYYTDTVFLFDTLVNVSIKGNSGYSGLKTFGDEMILLEKISLVANAYNKNNEYTSVYDINNTNEKIEINDVLYDLLKCSLEAQKVIKNFNPMIGSLSELWKTSLAKNEVPSQDVIDEELLKMNESCFTLEQVDEKYYVQRIGEGKIDLGAIAKGYALDKSLEYLKDYSEGDYIIDAGNSSILLGEKGKTYKNKGSENPKKGNYSINIKALGNKAIYLKNAIVSTSGITEQNTKIDGITYSHIINPETGRAVSLYDQVILVSDATYGNGYVGDALSTSLMMSSLDEIKEAETTFKVKAIVIKDNNIIYQNEGITIK